MIRENIMDFTMLNLLKKYEPDDAADNYCGLQDEPIHRFYDNRSALIFSAPHATRTFRGHAVKKPDLYTGALARTAAIDSGTSALTRRRFAAEKHSITDFITAQRLQNHHFLDIHGMSGERVFELAVGTGILSPQIYGPVLAQIAALADKYEISWVLNHPDYTGRFGLTGDLQRLSPQPRILQLEWRLDMRDFYRCPDNVLNRTLPFLTDLALFLIRRS